MLARLPEALVAFFSERNGWKPTVFIDLHLQAITPYLFYAPNILVSICVIYSSGSS